MPIIKNLLNNIETYICRILLAFFVTLLFVQIISRQIFGYSITWSEELAVYAFVWFVYLGASHAAKISAHNRVTFQYKILPKSVQTALEIFSDIMWIGFNLYFIYLSYDFVFNRMNLFWKSQTLGIPMKYIYMILPFAFVLMTIRIIQVDYLKYIKGVNVVDPEKASLDEFIDSEKHKPN